MSLRIVTGLPAAGLALGSALAQAPDAAERLAAAARVDCRFTAVVNAEWEGGTPEGGVGTANLEAAFFDINVSEGSAEAEGPFGDAFIVVRFADGYLHFLQMSGTGPLRVTTVLAQEAADGRLKAVHTRHEYSEIALPGFTSRPEMYVGDCAVE